MNIGQANDVMESLALMPDPALQQYAQLHKDDPYIMSLAMSESARRQKLRAAQQAQAGQMPQPKVVDQAIQAINPPPPQQQPMPQPQAQLPEQQGVAQLPAPNMQQMADGGIAGYAGKNESLTKVDPFFEALDLENVKDPREIAYLRSIYSQESSSGKNAKTSNRGAVGGMQIKPDTFSDVADPGMNIKNPVDNARAGIRYALQGFRQAKGDPQLAAAYYYGGPKGFEKAQKGIAVSDPVNPKAPTTLGYGKEVADRMTKLLPIGSAQAADTAPANKAGITALPAAQGSDLSGPMEFYVPQVSGTAPTRAPVQKAPSQVPTEPWYDRYRKALTSGEGQRQMLLGVGDLPYNLAGSVSDIGSAISKSLGYKGGESYLGSKNLKRLGTEYLGREKDSTDPTLREMREIGELGSLAIDPFATTKRVVQGTQGLQDLAAASRAKAAQAEKSVSNLRLEPPRTEPPVMVANPKGGVMPADSLRRVEQALTDEARAAEMGTIAAHNERAARMAPNAEQRAAMLGRAGMYDTARGAVGAAKVGNMADSDLAREFLTSPSMPPKPTTGKERGAYLSEGLPAYTAAGATDDMVEKERGAYLPDRQASTEPDKEDKSGLGFTNEDLLRLGLNLMAGKSPHALANFGEAGIKTLDTKMELAKQQAALKRQERQDILDEKKQAMLEKYYGPLAEQALANAEYIRGQKSPDALKMKAMQLAETEYAKWASDPMGGGLADAATKATYRQNIFNDYFSRMGLGGTSGTMASVWHPQLQFIGSRPG